MPKYVPALSAFLLTVLAIGFAPVLLTRSGLIGVNGLEWNFISGGFALGFCFVVPSSIRLAHFQNLARSDWDCLGIAASILMGTVLVMVYRIYGGNAAAFTALAFVVVPTVAVFGYVFCQILRDERKEAETVGEQQTCGQSRSPHCANFHGRNSVDFKV